MSPVKRQDRELDGTGSTQRTSHKRQKTSSVAQPTTTTMNVEQMQEEMEEVVVVTPVRLPPSRRTDPLTPRQTSGQFAVKPKKGDPAIPLQTYMHGLPDRQAPHSIYNGV